MWIFLKTKDLNKSSVYFIDPQFGSWIVTWRRWESLTTPQSRRQVGRILIVSYKNQSWEVSKRHFDTLIIDHNINVTMLVCAYKVKKRDLALRKISNFLKNGSFQIELELMRNWAFRLSKYAFWGYGGKGVIKLRN